MHPLLEKHLGRSLSAADVAAYLQCDISTVYRNYQSLGGVRIGTSYRFFEQRLINALLGQEKKKMGGADKVQEKNIPIFSAKQDQSKKMGSGKKARIEKSAQQLGDPHGLLA